MKKTAQEYFTHCRTSKDGDYVGNYADYIKSFAAMLNKKGQTK